MSNISIKTSEMDIRLAARLKALRTDRGWSLDDLAERSGISRATLSRLEKREVSPTANVLGKLCSTYGLTMSRLLWMVEAAHIPLVVHAEQPIWTDTETGLQRRSVSPPGANLMGEVLECELPADVSIEYAAPATPGLEHHLILLEGALEMNVEGELYRLNPGDCLRYKLYGTSAFRTRQNLGAKYILVVL